MNKLVFANENLCTGCKICAITCSINKFGIANPRSSGVIIHRDPFTRYEWQSICRHCDEPPCIDACMTGSLQKDPITNIVFNDFEKCVGCWACVMVCPYGAISADYELGKAIQCDLCRNDPQPLCVQICPTEALVYEKKP